MYECDDLFSYDDDACGSHCYDDYGSLSRNGAPGLGNISLHGGCDGIHHDGDGHDGDG